MSGRLVSDAQLQAALDALGMRQMHSTDPDRPIGHGFLLGALLALVETALRAEQADDGDASAGYQWALLQLAAHDDPAAARTWALLLQERLHRTAAELRTAAAAGERDLVDVAGPAALAAANLLTLLHHTAPAPGLVSSSVTTGQANLAAAGAALAALREQLRRDGFQV